MVSQVFWLLSYVSLGLALTLGNRPASIHSSQQQQQQQQKQQSTSSSSSSSQTQKSRQDHRFSRDPTISDVGNELSPVSAPEDQLNHLRSYRYEEPVELDDDLTRDWLDRGNKPWRDPLVFFRRREQLDVDDSKSSGNGNVREASSSRGNAFLDDFATAVLDTLYPRHRDLLVPAKLPNIPQDYETRRYDVGNNEPIIGYTELALQQQQQPRTVKNSRISTTSGQHEFLMKNSRSPVVVYRTDESEEAPLAIGEKWFNIDKTEKQRHLVQKSSRDFVDNARSSVGEWSNEPIEYSNRNNEIKSQGGDYPYRSLASSGSSSTTSNVGNSKPPGKRNQGGGGRGRSSNTRGWSPSAQQSQVAVSNAGASIASQFLLRSARGNRQYDVPQIECPASEDGMERFACPTPDRMGRYRCIDDHVLCDGFIDCPAAEDEDRQDCMFYKTTKAHLDVLADALLRWARGR